jgi:hypothetical protein
MHLFIFIYNLFNETNSISNYIASNDRTRSRWWTENWGEKPEYSANPVPVLLCPPQIPHDLTWARTRAAATSRLSYGTANNELETMSEDEATFKPGHYSVNGCGGSGQSHAPATLFPRTHCIGVCTGPRAKLDAFERRKIFRPFRISSLILR